MNAPRVSYFIHLGERGSVGKMPDEAGMSKHLQQPGGYGFESGHC